MKALQVSTNPLNLLGFDNLESYKLNNNINTDIEKIKKINADLLIIPLEQEITYCENILFSGLELIIWLRLKNIKTHIIALSLYDAAQILKNTKYANILGTQSVSFFQIPFTRSIKRIEELIPLENSEGDFLKYINGLVDIVSFRHREANWWGIKALYDVYNAAYDTKIPYPEVVKDHLKTLNNQIVQRLHGYNDELIRNDINKLLARERNNIINQYNTQLCELNKNIEVSKSVINNFKRQNLPCPQFMQKEISDYENGIENIRNEISKIEKEDIDFVKQIKETIDKIIKSEPNILYIDDNANNGWLETLNTLMPGLTVEALIPNKEVSIEDFYINNVKSSLEKNKTLLLLDLRLFDEVGPNLRLQEISGYKLLKLIKESCPELPVLVISASNKIISQNELISIGADAFWTKEGVDENKTAIDSVENYRKLIIYILKLHSNRYSVLKELYNIYSQLDKYRWWESFTWYNGEITNASTDDIKEMLLQMVFHYRMFLTRYFITNNQLDSFEDKETTFFIAGLMNKIGGIVELIHEVTNTKSYKDSKNKLDKRKDFIRADINDQRNSASHYFSINLKFEDFEKSVLLLKKYLLRNHKFVQGKNGQTVNLRSNEGTCRGSFFLENNGNCYKINVIARKKLSDANDTVVTYNDSDKMWNCII